MARKKNYLTLKQLDAVSDGADYTWLYSTRTDGKSFCVKSRSILDAYESIDERGVCHKQIAYMRRYDMDNKDKNITAYFADMPVEELTDGEYTHIVAYRRDIYFGHLEKGKVVKDVLIGSGFSVSALEHYKSLMYPYIYNIIYEEITTMSGQYLYAEPTMFLHCVSSIIRDRKAKVWLVGNIISRMCPYFDEWGIEAEKVKEGEKIQITFKEDDIETVLVFYHVIPSGDISGMFNIGRAKDNITKGKYYTELQQHLKRKPSTYNTIHTMVLEYDNFKYLMKLIYYTDYEYGADYAWYIEPKTSVIQPSTRIVTNALNRGGKFVTDSFRPLSPNEDIAFRYLFDKSKVFFNDNLTGTEFYSIINNFK